MASHLMKVILAATLFTAIRAFDSLSFQPQPDAVVTQGGFDNISERCNNFVDTQELETIPNPLDSPLEETVELPLDHFSECSDTYPNRYWVQEQWYKPGGPVFIYDVGEVSAGPEVGRLQDGFFARMLQEFNGIGILWEHRFYGNSKPSGNDQNLTFLTVEQSLADIPTMAVNFSRPNYLDVDLTPASTPWIFIGCSYPGIRAAISRMMYPEIFHAAWAASAPVEAKVDMWSYFYPIIPGMKAAGKEDCLTDLQVAFKKIDEYLDHESSATMIKEKFFPGHNATSFSNGDFALDLTAIWLKWQYFGADSMNLLCQFIQKDPESNSTAPPGGWTPTKGANYVINRMAKFAYDNRALPYARTCKLSVDQSTSGWIARADLERLNYVNSSWTWQYCTQFGFLQDYSPELDHIFSKYNSVTYQENFCKEIFPTVSMPASEVLNDKYGGWDMRPSNVFWSADEFDGWRTKSPLSDSSDAPTGVTVSTDIPECGVSTGNSTIFGATLAGTVHCTEFQESQQARGVQALWAQALHKWLPCYQPKNKSNITRPIPKKCDANKGSTVIREPREFFRPPGIDVPQHF